VTNYHLPEKLMAAQLRISVSIAMPKFQTSHRLF
jgi:hypothetical protein